jgi:drug/metabolite transporter (DMT)-like permease
MENDVLKEKKHLTNTKNEENAGLLGQGNHQEYSTIEKSMEMTTNTTNFDLYKGFFFMFISCLLKSLFAILCKILLNKNLSITSFHLLTFKAYVMLCISLIVSVFYYFSSCIGVKNLFIFSRSSFQYMITRGIISVISISLTIFALKNAPISEVYSVHYIYPAIVILLSYFVLREKVGYFDIICLVSCFLGVILIIRPQSIFPSEDNITKPSIFIFALVFVGAILKAIEDILIRNVGLEINCLVVPFIYSIVGILLYPIPMCLTIDNKHYVPLMDHADFCLIFFIAVFSFGYQLMMTLAIQYENAGRVAMINYFQVFFMFLSDLFIFHRKMIILDILGTFIIFGFNFTNGLKKTLKRGDQLKNLKSKIPITNFNKIV